MIERLRTGLILSCFATIIPGAFAQAPTVAPPGVPENVLPGGGIATIGRGANARLYVTCGSTTNASTTPMYRYDRGSRTWSSEDSVRMAMPQGSFLTSQPDNQHLYTTQGSSMNVNFFGTIVFRVWGYDPANVAPLEKWKLGAGVCDPHYGPNIPLTCVYSGAGRDMLYILCGGAAGISNAFITYSPDNNGGGGPYGKAVLPPGVFDGTRIASPWPASGFLYATQGNNTRGFWKYDTRTDAWVQILNVPEAVGVGASLCFGPNGSIYCVTGAANPTDAAPGFYRYDPSATTWTPLAPIPGQVSSGGGVSWVPDTDEVFVLKGGTTPTLWQYSIVDNVFAPRPAPPAQLVQRDSNTGEVIPLLGATANTDVVFEAGPIPAESAPLSIEVEVQPAGTAFMGTTTVRGPDAMAGSATVTVPGLTALGNYHWRARFRVPTGQTSLWRNFSAGPDGDFRRKANEAPVAGTVWAHRPGDSSLVENGAIVEDNVGGILFAGTASDPDLHRVRLQIRWRTVGGAWTDAQGEAVPSGQSATCMIAVATGQYEWIYRFVDSLGAATAWSATPAGFTVRPYGSTSAGACGSSSAGGIGWIGAVVALVLLVRIR